MLATTMAHYPDLRDKTVFITGGASGIGSDMVRAFHAQRARTVFVDIDETSAGALCRQLESETGSTPEFHLCDVTETRSLGEIIDRVADRTGRFDVLINNAANDTRRDTHQIGPDDWDAVVAVNLKHQYFAAQHAFPHLKRMAGGSVINFGSVAPRLGIPDLAVYSTCKAAVQGLTRSLAREFGSHGIRVNSIVPGCILTPRQLELWISPEDEKRILSEQCLPRRLIGEDVAQMALFLASDVSSACTSQAFTVDGGLTG